MVFDRGMRKHHRIRRVIMHITNSDDTSFSFHQMIYVLQTPLQNKPEDIHSLFQFLRLVPFEDKKVFMRFIGRPIQNGDPLGTSFLRTV